MGKRKCPQGASCKYKDEYQHQLEYTHDDLSTIRGGKVVAAGSNKRSLPSDPYAAPMGGRGHKLGRSDDAADLVHCPLCRSYIHASQMEDHFLMHSISTTTSKSSSSSGRRGKSAADVIDLVGSPPTSRPAVAPSIAASKRDSIKDAQDREYLQSVEANVSLQSERDHRKELERQAKEEQDMLAAIEQSMRDDEQRRFDLLREQQELIAEPSRGGEGVIEVKFAVRLAAAEASAHSRRFHVDESFSTAVQFLRSRDMRLFRDDSWTIRLGVDGYAQDTYASFQQLKIVANSRMSVIVVT